MLELRKVAVTGGLSCGKSSVCRIFKELGAYVVSADKIAHQLLYSDTTLKQKVVDLLGPDVLVDGNIDRSRIAKIVFVNPNLLQDLEKLIHPLVYKEIDKIYLQQKNSSSPPPLFIAEIPLLYESFRERNYDTVIAVTAEENICRDRFERATGFSQQEFYDRAARQLPVNEKALRADYIIANNGSPEDLQKATYRLYKELIKS